MADRADTTTKLVSTDDRGLIIILAIYGDFLEVLSKEAQTLPLQWPNGNAIDLEPGYNLQYGWICNFSEFGGMIFIQLPGSRSGDHKAGS